MRTRTSIFGMVALLAVVMFSAVQVQAQDCSGRRSRVRAKVSTLFHKRCVARVSCTAVCAPTPPVVVAVPAVVCCDEPCAAVDFGDRRRCDRIQPVHAIICRAPVQAIIRSVPVQAVTHPIQTVGNLLDGFAPSCATGKCSKR